MNQTREFISNIDRVFDSPIDGRVRKRAVYAFLDYICVTLAGTQYNRDKMTKFINNVDEGQYKIIGFDRTASLKDAVFLNGLAAHSLDFDDGTNAGIIHLGSPIFSAMLSLCEKYEIDNDSFYRAVIAGYETSFTLAYSIQPEHKKRGFHATGTCGTIGAALAICYALNLDEEIRFNAVSTACMAATGMLKVLDEGSELKPFNVAKTALLSLTSVEMAMAGFRGPENPFGGSRGLLAMMAGNEDLETVKPLLDGKYAIERAYIKPYAACRYCHPSIECAIALRNELLQKGIDINSITKVVVQTYKLAVAGHDHRSILNVSAAKMSIPYSVAVALTTGKAGLYEYTSEKINDSSVRSLLDVITVEDDEKMSDAFPSIQMARISAFVGDSEYIKEVDMPKGEPENPLTESEFRRRFYDMCLYAGKKEENISEIYEAVSLEEKKIAEIIKAI